ncbi:MAG: hypothetical protein JJLCMIEE_00028 [Acidimicrobiales bacterium]|nr:hypothetical protein [Acidimicrobiales bacterium]
MRSTLGSIGVNRGAMTTYIGDPVRSVMIAEPVFVSPDACLREAASSMVAAGIGVLVVGDGVRPMGMLSERDLVEALSAGTDPDDIDVEAVMSRNVISASAMDPIHDVALQMFEGEVRHLPVMEADQVVGVVSVRDLLRPLLLSALDPGAVGTGAEEG